MGNQALTLSYLNEDDRAYGLAGMTIVAAALGAADLLSAISIDAPDNMVTFSHRYYFSNDSALSPKAVWKHTLRSYHISAAMALANVFARSKVRLGAPVPDPLLATLHQVIVDEGKDYCELETDEADEIYNRTLGYSHRIFDNTRLYPAIREFANLISRRRTLSGREIIDELESLQLL